MGDFLLAGDDAIPLIECREQHGVEVNGRSRRQFFEPMC
jgi:hypothetical protein